MNYSLQQLSITLNFGFHCLLSLLVISLLTVMPKCLLLTRQNCSMVKDGSLKLDRSTRGIRIIDSPLILIRGEELGTLADQPSAG
jgi:hypothetical protein